MALLEVHRGRFREHGFHNFLHDLNSQRLASKRQRTWSCACRLLHEIAVAKSASVERRKAKRYNSGKSANRKAAYVTGEEAAAQAWCRVDAGVGSRSGDGRGWGAAVGAGRASRADSDFGLGPDLLHFDVTFTMSSALLSWYDENILPVARRPHTVTPTAFRGMKTVIQLSLYQ